MLNDKESPFTLTLTDSGLCLPVVRFHGEEALNQPYRFDIELIGLAPAVTPGTFLHQRAFLRLDDHHGIHGVIDSASCEHRGTHRIGYRVTVVPRLHRLAQPSKRRVFVQQSVPQILQQLLTENALPADGYRIEMTVGRYPIRPFCIQYEESDLALLHRLCEEEGIHYHFEHRMDGHVVVFADDSLSLPQTPVLVPFKACEQTPSPCITSLYQHHHAAPVATLHAVRNRGQRAISDEAANHITANPLPQASSSNNDTTNNAAVDIWNGNAASIGRSTAAATGSACSVDNCCKCRHIRSATSTNNGGSPRYVITGNIRRFLIRPHPCTATKTILPPSPGQAIFARRSTNRVPALPVITWRWCWDLPGNRRSSMNRVGSPSGCGPRNICKPLMTRRSGCPSR